MVARRYLIALTVAGLVLAGCGSSSKSGSSNSTTRTTTAARPKPHPKVTITAKDFSFTMPPRIPAGYVDITIDNQGKEEPPSPAREARLDDAGRSSRRSRSRPTSAA